MKIVFSRKGFDSAAGKVPSPIINGVPISLPIPTERRSKTTYRRAGLGEIVEQVTKGRVGSDNRSRRRPLPERVGKQVIEEYERFREHARVASTYDQAMPYLPPCLLNGMSRSLLK